MSCNKRRTRFSSIGFINFFKILTNYWEHTCWNLANLKEVSTYSTANPQSIYLTIYWFIFNLPPAPVLGAGGQQQTGAGHAGSMLLPGSAVCLSIQISVGGTSAAKVEPLRVDLWCNTHPFSRICKRLVFLHHLLTSMMPRGDGTFLHTPIYTCSSAPAVPSWNLPCINSFPNFLLPDARAEGFLSLGVNTASAVEPSVGREHQLLQGSDQLCLWLLGPPKQSRAMAFWSDSPLNPALHNRLCPKFLQCRQVYVGLFNMSRKGQSKQKGRSDSNYLMH